MNRFELARPRTTAQARELLAEKPGSVLKAGGIDVLDHLKEHLSEPPRLVDLRSVPNLDQVRSEPDGTLRIGTLVTLARVAADPAVLAGHPALALPVGKSSAGLPVSMQLVGRFFDDPLLMRVAHAYQHATDWNKIIGVHA